MSDYCHRHGIFLDLVPGEAHWKRFASRLFKV